MCFYHHQLKNRKILLNKLAIPRIILSKIRLNLIRGQTNLMKCCTLIGSLNLKTSIMDFKFYLEFLQYFAVQNLN